MATTRIKRASEFTDEELRIHRSTLSFVLKPRIIRMILDEMVSVDTDGVFEEKMFEFPFDISSVQKLATEVFGIRSPGKSTGVKKTPDVLSKNILGLEEYLDDPSTNMSEKNRLFCRIAISVYWKHMGDKDIGPLATVLSDLGKSKRLGITETVLESNRFPALRPNSRHGVG